MRTLSKNRFDASGERLSLGAELQLKELCNVVSRLDARFAIPATSSNFSLRYINHAMQPNQNTIQSPTNPNDFFYITKSGIHKKDIQPGHFLKCNFQGKAIGLRPPKPSDETLLHAFIYEQNSNARCVLHCHAPEIELLASPAVNLPGHELLKALGKKSHTELFSLNVYQNSQDMTEIVLQLNKMADVEIGFVLEKHGIYVVGESVAQALLRLEALLHLFSCKGSF